VQELKDDADDDGKLLLLLLMMTMLDESVFTSPCSAVRPFCRKNVYKIVVIVVVNASAENVAMKVSHKQYCRYSTISRTHVMIKRVTTVGCTLRSRVDIALRRSSL